jgi:threonine dehydrogenase-like Zn-dependent dehydrogenase
VLGKSLVELAEVPEPEPSGDFVVVKIMASSICGTERHAYEEGLTPAHSEAGVVNLGHEAAGVVWKTSTSSRLKVGDRVNLFASITHCGRCRYCVTGRWILCQGEPRILGAGFHAEYVKIREDFCLPLAHDIPFEIGALFGDVLGTALHAIRRLRLSALDTVLVMGQGPIGLASSLICQFFGAKVVAADTNPKRLELAKACGAKETFLVGEQNMAASLAELAGMSGIDVAIDCAGAQASR